MYTCRWILILVVAAADCLRRARPKPPSRRNPRIHTLASKLSSSKEQSEPATPSTLKRFRVPESFNGTHPRSPRGVTDHNSQHHHFRHRGASIEDSRSPPDLKPRPSQ
ncbi:Uncharacterized protein Rs2_23910 [Raphanus sativus]|nr:Uncharacterized protein Rs2_23910 [Raphanus sativus]